MKKKKRGDFRGKTNKDAKRNGKKSFGYLNLPKGVNMLAVEPEGSIKFDIIPYEITDKRHPDKSIKEGIAIEGDLWYKRPFKIHRNVGAGDGETVVCPTSFEEMPNL